ncbi:GTP-binding ADP-ribosylation factor [Trichinella spiralis]|uniref:GTP-binding ADP-ribosylation factor n=1 Tax=Trichinella spiralis TaxID=6334 RepID=UPI0001EFB90B|nr:GTP-binding ADP-ribosylation factor [Trichinella spiralis]
MSGKDSPAKISLADNAAFCPLKISSDWVRLISDQALYLTSRPTQSPCLVEPPLEGLSKWKKILLWKIFDFDIFTTSGNTARTAAHCRANDSEIQYTVQEQLMAALTSEHESCSRSTEDFLSVISF